MTALEAWDAADDGLSPKLPYSAEAEQSVLGSLLIDNGAFERISTLLAACDFFNHAHRLIFGAIAESIDAGKPADSITICERLNGRAEDVGGRSYLEALSHSVPSAAHILRYAEIVRERAIQRRLIATSDEIRSAAINAAGRDIGDILTESEERLAALFREQHRKVPGARVPLLRLGALRDSAHAVSWLVKHVVPADSIGMMFGGSGTFKSFIALDCALHVAHGLPWIGRRTVKGAVIYIAAEGGAGLWNRIAAWHQARNLRWEDAQLYVVPAAINLTADAWRVVDAAQAVGVSPGLVVVDTLSQTYAGEENSANEMAAYLREIGTRFRQLWKASVLLIHHSGHQSTERPRGSSAIRANLDFMLGVFRDEREMLATVSCIKQKDGEAFEDEMFAMNVAELGRDDDGDKVTSLVATRVASAEAAQALMSVEAQRGRGGRNHMLLSLAQSGMKERELRHVFYEQCDLSDVDHRRQAYHRALAWAKKSGLIEVADSTVILLDKNRHAQP